MNTDKNKFLSFICGHLCPIRGSFLFLFAVSSVASAAEVRVLTTHHYRIRTDLDPQLAEEIARRMDAMFEDYSRRLDDFSPGADHETLLVSLFAQRLDYCKYTGNRFPNTGGVFLPTKNALAAFLEGQGRDALRR